MPLLDHFGELRRRITIIAVSILVTAIVMYEATPVIIDVLLDPLRAFLPGGKLTVLTALGGFTIRFRIALDAGIIVCTPIIIWEIMAFFLPALKPSERRWVIPTVAALVILFYLGMLFCYLVALPAAFGWLSEQTVEFAQQIAQAEDYINIMVKLMIGFGIAFELPLVIFYLTALHLVPYSVLRAQWRVVYVAMMVLSATVTPDASPVTMLVMFAALVGLYELSLAVARAVITKRDGKQALKWSREDYERRDMDAALSELVHVCPAFCRVFVEGTREGEHE